MHKLPEPSFYERKHQHLAKTFDNLEKSASASGLRRNFQQQGKNSDTAFESDNSSLCNLLALHVVDDFNAIPVNIGHAFVTHF